MSSRNRSERQATLPLKRLRRNLQTSSTGPWGSSSKWRYRTNADDHPPVQERTHLPRPYVALPVTLTITSITMHIETS
eukprot:scaffold181584_cov60-Attheya_sp.AAC.4